MSGSRSAVLPGDQVTPAATSEGRRPGWRAAVGYAAAVAGPVTGLALLVRVDAVRALDERVIAAATARTRSDPGLRRALVVWQEAFQPRWVYLAGTGVAVLVARRPGLRRRGVWGVATMMASWNLALDVKYIVRRARPVVARAVSHAPGYSFPSGHAANVAAAATVVPLMVWPLLGARPVRAAVVLAAAVTTTLTALDRVLLGVHFPTDVAAGVLLGSGLALASYAGYRGRYPDDADHPHHGPLAPEARDPHAPRRARHTPKEA